MRSMTKVVLMVLFASTAFAQDGGKNEQQKIVTLANANDIDHSKFCVYENKVYSDGAVIAFSGRQIKCGSGLLPKPDSVLTWLEVDENQSSRTSED